MRIPIRPLAAAVVLSLSACSAAQSGLESVGGLADSAMGEPSGSRPIEVVVIEPGFASDTALIEALKPLVSRTVEESGSLTVLGLVGKNSSTMQQLSFSAEAGNGSFVPEGANSQAHETNRAIMEAAAMNELAAFIAGLDRQSTPEGADLVGALNSAVKLVENSEVVDRHVVVLTGGGLQASSSVDLLHPAVSTDSAETLAQGATVKIPEGIDVTIAGVGHMPDVDPTPDSGFTDGIQIFWTAVCAERGCTVQTIPSL